jgi:hypothetical protein
MPSRQVRITLLDLERLTFMRKDGAVIFGKMISIEGNKILYQNSSMKRALILRSELDEVWRDVQT